MSLVSSLHLYGSRFVNGTTLPTDEETGAFSEPSLGMGADARQVASHRNVIRKKPVMKQTVSAVLAAMALVTGTAAAGPVELRVTGIPSNEGNARIVLMDGPQGYTGERPPVRIVSVPVAGGQALWRGEMPVGTYAAIAHHDRNANDALDRPIFGLPLEPYGYSNAAWTSFGLPDYDAIAFDVGDGTTRQTIRLRMNGFVTAGQITLTVTAALAVLFGGLVLARRRRAARFIR